MTREEIKEIISGEGFTDFQVETIFEECGLEDYVDNEDRDEDDVVKAALDWWETVNIN